MSKCPDFEPNDAFKEDFKYYKNRHGKPDLSRVVDFSRPAGFPALLSSTLATTAASEAYGITPCAMMPCYELSSNPGLIVIPNAFTAEGQRFWIKRCLRFYPSASGVTNVDSSIPRPTGDINEFSSEFYRKLRWVTLGLHHNWDTKVYDVKNRSPFPVCLRGLTRHLAELVGYDDYEPEAAIVNYYHMKSTLSGHVDFSEFVHTSPLFSISFGQSAIFLIGGHTKDVRPTAVLLRSGDVVVMSGKSRLAYHGVPLIMPAENGVCWRGPTNDGSWEPFQEYISKNRINLNVRQVFDKR